MSTFVYYFDIYYYFQKYRLLLRTINLRQEKILCILGRNV